MRCPIVISTCRPAQEHGFRTWAEFRAHIESRSATEDRPVSRLMGIGPSHYASLADALLTELDGNDPGALRRLRAYVPRHADATDAAAPAAAGQGPAGR